MIGDEGGSDYDGEGDGDDERNGNDHNDHNDFIISEGQCLQKRDRLKMEKPLVFHLQNNGKLFFQMLAHGDCNHHRDWCFIKPCLEMQFSMRLSLQFAM